MVPSEAYQVLGVPDGADMTRIVRAWLELVEKYNPYQKYKGSVETYNRAMDAFLTLRNQEDGLMARLRTMADKDYANVKLNGYELMVDWAPYYVQEMMWKAEGFRDGQTDISLSMVEMAAEELDLLPAFIPGPRLYTVHGFHVAEIITRLLDMKEFRDRALPEDPDAFKVIWRNSIWKSKNRLVAGMCGPISKREQQLYQGNGTCPLWKLELCLPYWTLLTDDQNEREALVHHEMCHAKLEIIEKDEGKETILIPNPKGTPHTIEQHVETMGRYGVQNSTEALAIAHAYLHPRTQAILKEINFDAKTGQGLLFPPLRETMLPSMQMRSDNKIGSGTAPDPFAS